MDCATGFSILRQTIELTLDELLSEDNRIEGTSSDYATGFSIFHLTIKLTLDELLGRRVPESHSLSMFSMQQTARFKATAKFLTVSYINSKTGHLSSHSGSCTSQPNIFDNQLLLHNLLLVPEPAAFFVNWLLIAFCGLASAVLVIWKQRAGLLLGSASVGTFLCILGTDLAVNQQSGMSQGLRYLIDRNSYHIVDTMSNGYFPPTGTLVMIALSIALMFFKGPFCPVHDNDIESLHASNKFPADEEPKPSGEEILSSSPNSSPVSALSQSMPLLKDCCSIPAAMEKNSSAHSRSLSENYWIYRDSELVHSWVHVDWEAGQAGVEDLLARQNNISSFGSTGNCGLPEDDVDDLIWSDEDER
ncbi:uncharacterized protein F5147DRAFT_650332 [Suillus discolor]|uniref:Uncharacterized protein n=1 Tax=Suillus discolor TaxID=1912936 RepID=A0A9P7JXB2_9AGAM|nr:uncharacterized protein F5147DRAFT_650332 [Suillus discolor]KAG2113951.1 hypothetical protein F5147DRAFT_650332 [Suillus discolor]